MRKTFLVTIFFGIVCNLLAQNVMISDKGSPNETSVMFHHKDTATILVGANINNIYVSKDAGRTWTAGKLSSPYGVWGDPVLDVDSAGNFYYFHLSNPADGSWIDRIICQKSTDKGENWSDGTFTGKNGERAQDKHWSAIDPASGRIYLTWTQFDKYGSKEAKDSTLILFSASEDGGLTWREPMRISKFAGNCVDSDSTVEGAVPAIGPNGEVYVSWAGPAGLVFNRSLDGGLTWLPQEIQIDPFKGGWDYKIPGLGRCNGLPITKCDLSKSPYRGTIYVNWSDQRHGNNDTDIWIASSTDGGKTWGNSVRVNDDKAGNHQFMCWMDVDQANGHIYVLYYDRRHASEDNSTHVFLARSTDGGKTFVNRRISESPFIPKSFSFFGDYTNVKAYNGFIRPVWTRSDKGKLSIWIDLTSPKVFED